MLLITVRYCLKLHSHNSRNQCFSYSTIFAGDDRRIWSRIRPSYQWIRIRDAQKHTDPTDLIRLRIQIRNTYILENFYIICYCRNYVDTPYKSEKNQMRNYSVLIVARQNDFSSLRVRGFCIWQLTRQHNVATVTWTTVKTFCLLLNFFNLLII